MYNVHQFNQPMNYIAPAGRQVYSNVESLCSQAPAGRQVRYWVEGIAFLRIAKEKSISMNQCTNELNMERKS